MRHAVKRNLRVSDLTGNAIVWENTGKTLITAALRSVFSRALLLPFECCEFTETDVRSTPNLHEI